MGHAKGENREQDQRESHSLRLSSGGIPAVRWFQQAGIRSEKRGMTWQGWEPRAADSLVCRRPVPLIIPTDTRTSFVVFRNYRLRWQLVAFQRRFRLLELLLPEIRPEFDRHTSNAGMLQSGMPHPARFQALKRSKNETCILVSFALFGFNIDRKRAEKCVASPSRWP